MIRVLVVDDDFRVATLHTEYANRCQGFAVVGTALSGREAVSLAAELQPDLVLLDLYLPDLHGLDVARQLHENGSLDIIVISAARDVASIRTAVGEGALHYLVKPFTFAILRERMERYRRWRQNLDRVGEANQPMIDEWLAMLRAETTRVLPKGLSEQTLRLVETALREAAEPLASDEVAHITGVSRVAAHRYLNFLAEAGIATMSQEYGTPGRPRQLFAIT